MLSSSVFDGKPYACGFMLTAQKAPDIEAWRRLEQTVALLFDVPLYEMRASKRRQARVAFARQVTMYLAHVGYGLSYGEIGKLCKRDRKTVRHACELVEQRRDDPGLDGLLDLLEASSRAFAVYFSRMARVRS